jgi:GTP-binding protein
MSHPFPGARFLKGAPSLHHSPADRGGEVAVAGRSNAGKSSAVNAILGLHKLARTSKTPGCTRQLNFFDLGDGRRLVDLPGYGYAKAPHDMVQKWQATLARYLRKRRSLRALLLVTDIRHALSPGDHQLLWLCRDMGIPIHVLLNKADKLGRGESLRILQEVRHWLAERGLAATVQLFSARTHQGTDDARSFIEAWADPEVAQRTKKEGPG